MGKYSDPLDPLTRQVIGAAFEVSNTLGAGFLEKVYQRALLRELTIRGVHAVSEPGFDVTYKGELVGSYRGDLLVEDSLLVEIKCTDRFADEHMAQCLNYLRASGKTLCLLLNFQKPLVNWKRIVLGYGPADSADSIAVT